MTIELNDDWMKRQAREVGQRIRRTRMAAGLSVQAVADSCTTELGYKMLRTTLANLESGARKNITVAEVSALAAALGVAPAALLFPIDEPASVEVLPGSFKTPWESWLWFTGAQTLITRHSSGPAWNANSPSLDFMGALLAYANLEDQGSVWDFMQKTIDGLKSLESRENLVGLDAVSLVAATEKQQIDIAKKARQSMAELQSRGLPLPNLPPAMRAAIENFSTESDEQNA